MYVLHLECALGNLGEDQAKQLLVQTSVIRGPYHDKGVWEASSLTWYTSMVTLMTWSRGKYCLTSYTQHRHSQ